MPDLAGQALCERELKRELTVQSLKFLNAGGKIMRQHFPIRAKEQIKNSKLPSFRAPIRFGFRSAGGLLAGGRAGARAGRMAGRLPALFGNGGSCD